MVKVSAVALYAVTVVFNSDCAKRVCCYIPDSGFTFIHTAAISCDELRSSTLFKL
ncbi:hypothetical protein PO909_025222 [Leuciscus waleckii]